MLGKDQSRGSVDREATGQPPSSCTCNEGFSFIGCSLDVAISDSFEHTGGRQRPQRPQLHVRVRRRLQHRAVITLNSALGEDQSHGFLRSARPLAASPGSYVCTSRQSPCTAAASTCGVTGTGRSASPPSKSAQREHCPAWCNSPSTSARVVPCILPEMRAGCPRRPPSQRLYRRA